MIIFCDLETTGLDPTKHTILEVAVILTDDKFNEVWRQSWVTDEAATIPLQDLDPFVQNMHLDNGLWVESARPRDPSKPLTAFPIDNIDRELATILSDTEPNPLEKWLLAGNTVSFDRGFIERWLPFTFARLHYRNLDVTSFNEVAKRAWPELYESRPRGGADVAHRAMPDIQNSVDQLKHYLKGLSPVAIG